MKNIHPWHKASHHLTRSFIHLFLRGISSALLCCYISKCSSKLPTLANSILIKVKCWSTKLMQDCAHQGWTQSSHECACRPWILKSYYRLGVEYWYLQCGGGLQKMRKMWTYFSTLECIFFTGSDIYKIASCTFAESCLVLHLTLVGGSHLFGIYTPKDVAHKMGLN